jgi:hypothetical protein
MTEQRSSPVSEQLHRLPDGRTNLKAHDIRHLGLCAICGGIADQRTSISYRAAYDYEAQDPNAMWHPKCTFEHFGEKFVLDLPESEQNKFCLSDVPVSTMKKIIGARP